MTEGRVTDHWPLTTDHWPLTWGNKGYRAGEEVSAVRTTERLLSTNL